MSSVRRRRVPNRKRKLAPLPTTAKERAELVRLSKLVRYGGNPDHKRNPGDFGLTPPSNPRPDKSLCDDAGIVTHGEAERVLRKAVKAGLVSTQFRNGWPQNVWGIAENGVALEAMLENPAIGAYHGYPMLSGDPFIEAVRDRWVP